jgi:predicted nucleic acid-binding protein
MVSFDTNILVYATLSVPLARKDRARDLLVLQTPAEFSGVAIRKAGTAVDEVRATIDAWRAVLPVALNWRKLDPSIQIGCVGPAHRRY